MLLQSNWPIDSRGAYEKLNSSLTIYCTELLLWVPKFGNVVSAGNQLTSVHQYGMAVNSSQQVAVPRHSDIAPARAARTPQDERHIAMRLQAVSLLSGIR